MIWILAKPVFNVTKTKSLRELRKCADEKTDDSVIIILGNLLLVSQKINHEIIFKQINKI